MKLRRTFFRFFAYALIIILLYVLQNTPNLMPQLFGSKPLMLVPLALAISAYERTIPSIIFGAVCGILTDIGTGSVGYYAVSLTLVCFIESELLYKYFVPSFLTAVVYAFLATVLLVSLYFLCFVLIAGVPNSGYLFVHHYISRILYSFIMIIPLYFLIRSLFMNLQS